GGVLVLGAEGGRRRPGVCGPHGRAGAVALTAWDSTAVVLTGGAGHLGSVVARRLAKLGAHVMAVDRDADGLAGPGRSGLTTFAGDVSVPETARAAVRECVARWGGL